MITSGDYSVSYKKFKIQRIVVVESSRFSIIVIEPFLKDIIYEELHKRGTNENNAWAGFFEWQRPSSL